MILKSSIRTLAVFISLAVLFSCGNDVNNDNAAGGNAAQPDIQSNKNDSEADEEISAANRQVLLFESQLSLPDTADYTGRVRYYLPFEAGKHRGVSQGVNGSTSHFGRLSYAIDWNLTGYSDYRLPVLTSAPGTVLQAEMLPRFGNCVVIRHADGSKTRYAHLDEIDVAMGQAVGQADKIGLVGTTGHSSGPHLHFETLDAQMNGILPVFAEQIPTPFGDTPCSTANEESGCYISQNSPTAETAKRGNQGD